VNTTPDLGQPLVLATQSQPRLYLRRYWRWEQAIAHALVRRSQQAPRYQASTLRPWLTALFPASPFQPDWQQLACAMALNSGLTVITGGPGTGKTYTAARVLVALLATAPDPNNLRIALAAPTGKAAARLKQSIDSSLQVLAPVVADRVDLAAFVQQIKATTLHRLLGARGDRRQWRHDAAHPLALDVLIVDEASMIHLEMMAALLAALPPQAQLMLLGDKDQLDSVEAGAVLGDLCREAAQGHYTPATRDALAAATGMPLPPSMVVSADADLATLPPLAQHTVMLRDSRRFEGPIGELAQLVNVGDGASAAACLHRASQGVLQWDISDTPDIAVKRAVQGRPMTEGHAPGYLAYARLVKQGPSANASSEASADGDIAAHEAWVHQVLDAFEQVRVLCATREGAWGVEGLNEAIEAELARHALLSLQGEWYAGRPVMVTRNDTDLGVFNGDIGLTLPAPRRTRTDEASTATANSRWRVYFRDGPHLRSVGAGRLAHIETAFALTVHKSQGSEFAHTLLVLPQAIGPLLNRPLVYTGITRAKIALTLVTPNDRVLHQALHTQASRHSGLSQALLEAVKRDIEHKCA
jgi:exodeoxyribonuclease V alpha subunit